MDWEFGGGGFESLESVGKYGVICSILVCEKRWWNNIVCILSWSLRGSRNDQWITK